MYRKKVNRYDISMMLKNNSFWYELCFFVIVVLVSIVVLSPVLIHQGWPHNHEGLSFMYRTALYAQHFTQGDIFPIWSSADAFGLGTPLPLFYHKLFYYIAGSIAVLLTSTKMAVISTLILFMIFGAYGFRFALRYVVEKKTLLLIGSVCFLMLNYVTTDIIVRGAMAEATALMIIPWMIWWCLKLLKEDKFSRWISVILATCFYAHNIIAVMGVVMLALAFVLFLAKNHWRTERGFAKDVGVSVGLFTALIAPQVIISALFYGDYNPAKITEHSFLATEHFEPVYKYLFDTRYTWFKDWKSMTFQVDYALMVFLGVTIPIAIYAYRTRLLNMVRNNGYLVLFLAGSLGVYICLQLPLTHIIYTTLSIPQLLQFPWRLLAYCMPLLLIFVFWISNIYREYQVFVMGVVLVGFIIFLPAWHPIQSTYMPRLQVRYDTFVGENNSITGTLLGIGEYLPVIKIHNKELSALEAVSYYGQSSIQTPTSPLNNLYQHCMLYEDPQRKFEQLTRKFYYSCAKDQEVILPISYSKALLVSDDASGRIAFWRTADDPRLRVLLKKNPSGVVNITLPSVKTLLKKLL